MNDQPHIIVIDDDSMIRLMVVAALKAVGLNASEAGSGEEGLQLFVEKGAHAILLDVMMPDGMDGFATCIAFRQLPDTLNIPVLMMTGLDDIESINRAYDAGATDFITKPINLSLLGHRVRYMLRAAKTTNNLVESERRLHRMAYFDSLTQLPNREFFKEHLKCMVALAERKSLKLAVLFLDLDGFKRINDTLGHQLGDLVLQKTSDELRNSIRACDALIRSGTTREGDAIARLGGDEFTVLLAGVQSNADAAIVAERILSNLSKPLIFGEHELYSTTSIGIAIYPHDGKNSEELLKNADLAMYYAKREGGNEYRYFTAEMSETALQRLNMENQLRKAIERGELELHYQPQYDLSADCCCGVEALLRWDNQEFGRISPAVFIPLAEDSGLIISIGEWVLRTACYQFKRWQEQGVPICRVAVNVSAMQFLHKGFTELVASILNETGVLPQMLELELTESVLINDEAIVLDTLNTLSKIGVQLAIDDFGTGYSSLSRLKHFPINRLKIDQSFIRNIEYDSKNAAVVVAIIAMAEGMSMNVIAEGVENASELAFLKNKHCLEVQGFFMSKPLPASEIQVVIAKYIENQV
ncbi:EAL domain-containing protein [Methylomonas sp. AM2-LC]|uniref:two-component system response regulator n=1 Tax=Methylomonas sp. AM2-LC TaxID=3153301 RepID=UPI0032659949